MKNELVVLVPGTESAAQAAFSGLGPLLARDYEVRLFDYRSELSLDPAQNLAGYIEQLLAFIRDCGDRPVHLLGYSLGAHIALSTAAAGRPVASLCMVAGWLQTDAMQRERHDLWLDLFERDPALAGRLSHLLQYSPTYRSFLAEQQTTTALTPSVPDDEIRMRVAVNRIVDATEAARRLTVPTLIVSGTADMKVHPNHALQLFGAIRNATLVETSGGHALLRERLGQVYGSYLDFLQGLLVPGRVIDTLVP
jgi:pimeloyl-ACP methyl ester carboxylesterase